MHVQPIGDAMLAIKVNMHDLQLISYGTVIFSAAGFDLVFITAGVSITAALVLVLVCICLVYCMKRYDNVRVEQVSLNIIVFFMKLDNMNE